MTTLKGKGKPRKPAVPASMGYAELAAHLGVGRRTLVRYVTSGMVPTPVTEGTRCVWRGEDLVHAMSGRGYPGAFEYTPSPRETARSKTIKAKQRKLKPKRARHDTSASNPSAHGGAL